MLCRATELGKWEDTGKAHANYLRMDSIKNGNDEVADVLAAKLSFPKVHWRYYVEPTATIPSGLDLINPDNSTVTWPM